MGLFVEFDVVMDFGYMDQTEEYGIIPDYSEGCEVFVETFLNLANQYVPVDTGYLKSTLTANCDDTYCCAETDCEYAQYPEFGTWCSPEQPYFRPALEQAIMMAQPFWDKAEEEAILEEEMLIEEEEAMQQAQALAQQQGRSYGATQAQKMDAWSRGAGPQAFGGINFSSIGAFIGSVIGAFISAFVITTVQAMLGKDFGSSAKSSSSRGGGGGMGGVFIPEITIT